MTIEIRQLIVRAVVERPRPETANPPAPAAGPVARTRPGPAADRREEPRDLVAACVREVLRRLEQARER